MQLLLKIIEESWAIVHESSFYILFGFFFSGILRVFFSTKQITKFLGPHGFPSVLAASIFGLPLPLCSCGVVPAALSLRRSGASRGATVSFLISTPETGVDSLAVSYALLDPILTVVRQVAAFLTALFTGLMENVFSRKPDAERPEPEPECPHCRETENVGEHRHGFIWRLKGGMRFAFTELLDDIAVWFVLGILLAGVIAALVPEDAVTKYLAPGLPTMLVMLAVGIPIYVCATASTPIAAALVLKGVSPGAALVFLLAGPATNAATMTVVAKELGARSFVIYVASIFVATLAFGLATDWLYFAWNVDAVATVGTAPGLIPAWLKTVSAAIFLLLTVKSLVFKAKRP